MNTSRKLPIYYGWWVLVSSCLIIFLAGTCLFGFSAYYPSFIESFGWSRTRIVLGSSFMLWTFGVTGLVWGTVADRRGVRVVLAIGTTCVALAYLLYTQMSALWQFYAIAIIYGAGLSAMAYLPNQILQSRWFTRRRGLAIGIVTSASAVGGIVAPVLITFLIMRVGWRSTMGLFDVLLWIVPFLLIIFVIRERPEDIGLHPDGAVEMPATTNVLQG